MSPSVHSPAANLDADLGLPEVWRYDGQGISVLLLNAAGAAFKSPPTWATWQCISVLLLNAAGGYEPAAISPSFPFLPLDQFQLFVERLLGEEEQNAVINEFRDWAKGDF